jgi:FeS assembly SUF system regulator
MIRIGKLTDYAMLIMGEIAKASGSILSAAHIADALHLTTPTVSKILKMLSEAGLVSSVRGAEGGYYLAKPAENITIADIICAMEGEIALTVCCEQSGRCSIDSLCTMRENWIKINRMIHSFLAGLTILDMSIPISSAGFLQRLVHGK